MFSCFSHTITGNYIHHLKLFFTKTSLAFLHNRGQSCFHIIPSQIKIGDMNVKILPFLEHNYMFMITDTSSKKTVAIDPGQPELIFSLVERDSLDWEHILITHHHSSHQNGNQAIKACRQKIEIIAGDDRVEGLDYKIKHFEGLQVGCMRFRFLYTPGHTNGHYCYYVESTRTKDRCIFTGDLLISGGVGRLDGSPSEMYHSLQILYSLPDDTRIFCGHESTIKNLKFAVKVEPENVKVVQRLKWACEHANEGLPLMLSTIGQEKMFNPFMRVTEKCVQDYCQTTDPYCIIQKLNEELHLQIDEKENN